MLCHVNGPVRVLFKTRLIFPCINDPIVYDAILRRRHATSSNEDFDIFSPLSVLNRVSVTTNIYL